MKQHQKKSENRQKYIEYGQKVVKNLFKRSRAKDLSYEYRQTMKEVLENDKHLTYGEVDSESFLRILAVVNDINPNFGKTFYDLGSGSGLACITSALSSYQFSSIKGIELVPSLASLSNQILQKLIYALHHPVNSKPLETGMKQKIKKSSAVVKSMEEGELLARIMNIITQSTTTEEVPMLIESLANKLCQSIGHKQYRATIKPYHSFLSLLQKHPLRFIVSEDGKLVSLQTSSPEVHGILELEPLESEFSGDAVPSEMVEDETTFNVSSDISEFYLPRLPDIQLIEGDIFQIPWWENADVVYTASLLFSDSMMDELSMLALRMKPDSIFITLKPLPITSSESLSVNMILVHESFFKMSWQMAKVYIYQLQSNSTLP